MACGRIAAQLTRPAAGEQNHSFLQVSSLKNLSRVNVCVFFVVIYNSPLFALQVHQFSNKQTEMALRVASLDYLGTVASSLRKDAVTSTMDQKDIDRILSQVGKNHPRITIFAEI